MASAIQLMHNMMVAHAKAVIAYKEAGHEGKIGIVHSLESKYPYDKTKDEDVKAAKNEDVLNNQFLLDATFLGKYRDCLLYTSPSPRDRTRSRMPSSA